MEAEIERMAREAGLTVQVRFGDLIHGTSAQVERFAMLVEQRAIDRAAKVCEEAAVRYAACVEQEGDRPHGKVVAANSCAAAIRSSAPRSV